MSGKSILDTLPLAPSEDPFVVEHGGFYRRWFYMIDDLQLLQDTVATLKGTTDDLWVPVWRGGSEKNSRTRPRTSPRRERAPPRARSFSRRKPSTASPGFRAL